MIFRLTISSMESDRSIFPFHPEIKKIHFLISSIQVKLENNLYNIFMKFHIVNNF